MIPEEKFIHELEVFRAETQSGTKFFYAYIAIQSELAEKTEVLSFLNETPLFWKTNIGALQISLFITLGRIFDKTSKHNIDNLLKLVEENKDIFSKAPLGARRRKDSDNVDGRIEDFLKKAYEPTEDDFNSLKKKCREVS